MNCFIDKGEGENLENLSTCFSIPEKEPFDSKNWANFIVIPVSRPQLSLNQGQPVLSPLQPSAQTLLEGPAAARRRTGASSRHSD